MIYVDIETVPLESSLAAEYPEADRNPPANYSKPEAIAGWRVKDKAAWQAGLTKEASLNPRLGRILCIGLAWSDMADATVLIAKGEAQEKGMLEAFWEEVAKEGGRVGSWNGVWDLRFIVIRSMALGVAPTLPAQTIRAWFRRYSTAPHFDCRAVLTNWEPYKAGEGLDEWSEFFGIDGKAAGMSGADVYPLYLKGEFATIESYCAQDVAATKAVHLRIAPMFDSAEAA